MKICKENVCTTSDGKKLVSDGDPEAAFVVAVKGQQVADRIVEGLDGADKFFADSDSPEPPDKTRVIGNPPEPENRESDQASKLHKRGGR